MDKINYAAIRNLRKRIRLLKLELSELAKKELKPGLTIEYFMRGYRQTGVIQEVMAFGEPRVRVKSDKSGKVYDIYLTDIAGTMTPQETEALTYNDR